MSDSREATPRPSGQRWDLTFDRIETLPLIHGRLAFALEARRRLLAERFDAVAVELPASLATAVHAALDYLPVATAVLYRETPAFLGGEDAPAWYVPVHPGDGIIEALRIARGERVSVHFVDAEVQGFEAAPVILPDPHAVGGLGLAQYCGACTPTLLRHPRSDQDALREAHMAAELRALLARVTGRILFLCGMAHWLPVRAHLERGDGALHDSVGVPPEQVQIVRASARSIPHWMGDLPYLVECYERHRAGFELDDYDPVQALRQLLLVARERFHQRFPGSLEEPDLPALRTLLDYARRMMVRRRLLIPDSYTLTVAAHGVVGNDFAIVVSELANRYAPNGELRFTDGDFDPDDATSATEERATDLGGGSGLGQPVEDPGTLDCMEMSGESGWIVDTDTQLELRPRAPGTAFEFGRLRLERRPDPRRGRTWKRQWNPHGQCSHEPEDVVIESFRDYVGKRALSLARVATTRIQPFTVSLLDGVDARATLRDIVERRIHVREERRVSGAVGALVVIFEEDDFGERYPWRATWYAEHHNESTLSFYATDFMEDLIAPGIGRSRYGGFLMIFPPKLIPDIWDDLRFERAHTPSERLLLAAIYWCADHFIVHVSARPPSHAVRREAHSRKKHVLYLPLGTFSRRTLERLRRVHVLNGHPVRSWAHRFIR